jgi:hypothetical protein
MNGDVFNSQHDRGLQATPTIFPKVGIHSKGEPSAVLLHCIMI